MEWEDIIVSSKILGHISAGVYRSAGGALKELVSNAFDACATRVVITTNPPSFDIVSCHDNGIGMKLEDFYRIMKEGIGESSKRVDGDNACKEFTRPVIGRLGIGMLGIAQMCHSFKIVSHHRDTETAFQATIKLVDFLREKVDAVNPEDDGDEAIDVGKFVIEKIDYDPEKSGTSVITSDVRSAFINKFRENPGPLLPSKFSSFLEIIHNERSVRELGDYWQMVWDLSVACPIPYMDEGPFNWKIVEAPQGIKNKIESLKKSLKNYQFELVVDGLSLRKPNLYPFPPKRRDGRKLMTGLLFPIEEEMTVYGRPLKLLGYIYMQDGQAVDPFELRGLLIRIRNVAIGSYDPTFLDYPKIEGPRFNWLSSEIYVEEGLEHALNIDRDSFNEMHSHFVKVQQVVHKTLDEVFSQASRRGTKRSKIKRQSEQRRKLLALKHLLAQELEGKYELVEVDEADVPLIIDTRKKRLLINHRSTLWPRSQSKRELAELIAVAFEISMLSPEGQQRDRFYTLLAKLLNL